jgi:hypothetical protein
VGRAQLDTAIDWARYAELFEYDAAHGEITLPDFAETETVKLTGRSLSFGQAMKLALDRASWR